MKIAILYICTGKYNQFFKGFYESSEKYFLKGIATIEYFVFTDDMALSSAHNVHLIERQCQGFPLDSLFRFDMFLSIKENLQSYDYCFFFNSNMLFVAPVGEEFLPKKERLMAVIHPGNYNRPCMLFPYERRRESKAYIAPFDGPYYYYMGSLNGGITSCFLELAQECSNNIHDDYNRGIIAWVDDESHLNKYMHEHMCLRLSPSYAFPEDSNLPFKPIIIIRDKIKVDQYFARGRKLTFFARSIKCCNKLWRALRWYFKI